MKYCVVLLLLWLPGLCLAQQRTVSIQVRPAVGRVGESVQARYARLDQFARQLPEAQAATLDKLATALGTQARSDDDKARLIFTWIACHVAYDIAFLQGTAEAQVEPGQVLQRRATICQGYADLFTALATRMGLAAKTVAGHAKVDLARPVCPAIGTDGAHAWNVYQAGGRSHLADACWGAGSVSDDYQNFTREFNPFWFDTPPEQAIFLHLPDDSDWQLLDTPVTSAAFQQWPYLEDSWFRLGVSGASMRQALTVPKHKPRPVPLPSVYSTTHQIGIVQVPRQATLAAGQPVIFIFTVAPGVEVGLEADGLVVPFAAKGNYRRLAITPAATARPHIVVWSRADSTRHESLLEYRVARPLRRPGQPQAAADSVTYLRR